MGNILLCRSHPIYRLQLEGNVPGVSAWGANIREANVQNPIVDDTRYVGLQKDDEQETEVRALCERCIRNS